MSTTAGPVLVVPLSIRVALDLVVAGIARDADRPDGPAPARTIGVPWLIAEFERYGTAAVTDALIALGASPEEARAAIVAHRPARVWTVAAGPLGALLRPLRAAPVPLLPDLSPAAWRELGYVAATADGVEGPGAVLWAIAERAWTAGRRPDLADRCRIGLIRSMVATGGHRSLATVAVRAYRERA